MENAIVKNTNKRGDTTITIKVKIEFKREWEKFCINNDINASATLQNVLKNLIENYKG
jgi:hypothetical protein